MHATIKQCLDSGPILLDGGWGTELQQRGLAVGYHPDLWNLSLPEKVEEVARSYVEAGSQIILTNTFGSTRFTLARHGFQDKVAEINRVGVQISRKAAVGRAKVFASIGPTGMMLMSGNTTPEEMENAFREQATALAGAEPDGIVIETMSDPEETVLAVKAAKSTGLPVVACLVFDSGKNKDRTMMGTTPEQAVERLTDAGADVIGANCGQGVDGFIPICERMRKVTDLPLWMKANAGLPEFVDGKAIYKQTPEQFATKIVELVQAGANFVGGCCGTTPVFIAAVRKELAQHGPLRKM
ncbi:MAG: homocysteine S-methyltransferase family protein [Planctomycetaceae bacterium]|nr:homocysteine S-methyltransferase family protein [Planctomycetaceae bacterium]